VTTTAGQRAPTVVKARDAVYAAFLLAGFTFSTLASRIPSLRTTLALSPAELGLLLLAAAIGALVALPTTGGAVQRFGATNVVRLGAIVQAGGLVTVAVAAGALGSIPLTGAALFLVGLGNGAWDVGMNVEGAAVERGLGRSVMPRFHASFSLGTVAGGLLGTLMAWADIGLGPHIAVAAVLAGGLCVHVCGRFLPVEPSTSSAAPKRNALLAWTEPRTVVIGVMVLAMALTEGVANDWLAVALVDGYDVPAWLGTAGFALFVTAMTAGRLVGTAVLDRLGRLPVLWGTMALAAAGIVLVVFGPHPALVVLGIVLWGLGASLGFPVGMSAAADDPVHAAARVSVVSTIGYLAFLGGPPVLGFLGEQVGVLHALLLVAVLLVPSALAVPAARQPARD
jgi:MFS family permease